MKPEDWKSVSTLVDEIEYSSKKCGELLAHDAGNSSVRNFSRKMFCAFALYEDGESVKPIYITKSVPPHQIKGQGNAKYASYYSPMGRIASLDPGEGDEIVIPKGSVDVELLKKNEFVTVLVPSIDAVNNKFSTESGVFTFSSSKASLKEYTNLIGVEGHELLATVLQVVHLVAGILNDQVLFARGGNVEQHHAPADALLQVDILL